MIFIGRTTLIVKDAGIVPTLPELEDKSRGFDEIIFVQKKGNIADVSRIGREKDGGYRVVSSHKEINLPF